MKCETCGYEFQTSCMYCELIRLIQQNKIEDIIKFLEAASYQTENEDFVYASMRSFLYAEYGEVPMYKILERKKFRELMRLCVKKNYYSGQDIRPRLKAVLLSERLNEFLSDRQEKEE